MRRLRIEQGWTQEDLAEVTGGYCTSRTIGNWERGAKTPRWPGSKQLKHVAEALRTTPQALLDGEED